MKKKIFRVSFLIVAFAMIFNLAACDRTCYVRFETNGGSVLEDYRGFNGVYFDSLDDVPVTTKSGYRFDGWYYDAEFKKIVEFPFSSGWKDYTFFAKWQKSLLVDYEVTYESSGYGRQLFGKEDGENLFVIHSAEQLEFLVDSGQIGQPIAMSSIFSQNLLDYYNENYFESKALVLASYMFSSGPCENEFGDLRKEGKFLILDLIKINQGEDSALWWWNFILEIDKSHFMLADDSSAYDGYAQFLVNWIDGINYECEHDFGWITAPPARCGYGESNASWQICTKCNAEGESWVGPVLEHEWELVSEVEACKHCGKTKKSFLSESISVFNDNFNAEFKLAESMPSKSDIHAVNFDEFRLEMGFGCYLLYSDDDLTYYVVGGFPDCLDEYAITGFISTNPKYGIFGFSVGGSPIEAGNILTQRGYTLSEEDSTTGSAIYILGKIKITFSWDCDGGVGGILNIGIILDVTNLEGVEF